MGLYGVPQRNPGLLTEEGVLGGSPQSLPKGCQSLRFTPQGNFPSNFSPMWG